MLDVRAATRLLHSVHCARDLAPLACAAGCDGEPLLLDAAGLRRIELHEIARRAWVAPGRGSLRALLVDLAPGTDPAAAITQLASRLTRHAPAHLWLALVHGAEVSIAAWNGGSTRPRVSALRINTDRILASDAETMSALAAAAGGADDLVHARWLEILGRDALTARFYRTLEALVRQMAGEPSSRIPPAERRALALLQVSRLLFLSFLESKGWLSGDHRFLARMFEECAAGGGAYHRRVLRPLFFGTLNTPLHRRSPAARAFGRIPFLNGGLFARTSLERRHAIAFSDDAFGALFDQLLLRFRFTAREESTSLAESAVDPEMLGRAFESLMFAEERRAKGTFYTPLSMVSQLVDRGLATALRGYSDVPDDVIARAIAGEHVPPGAARRVRERLTNLTIVDPACGSGAFLVYVLERLAGMAAQLGDSRPAGTIRRAVLSRSIFGVDVDPTAVWLCELRLWLAVVVGQDVEDPCAVEPLPNLDHQIRVGDSLGGELPADAWRQPGGVRIARLRERYARSSGAGKRATALALERAERARALARVDAECAAACAARRELVSALRGRDLFGTRVVALPDDLARLTSLRRRIRVLRSELRRLRDGGALPFTWAVHTADVLDAGGFDLVTGNPPWVRLHRIPAPVRAALRARFEVFAHATWPRGAQVSRAGRGFAAQVDLAALFVERGLALARPAGALAMLVPAKLWRSLAGGGVRRLLATRTRVAAIEDWSEGIAAFDAAVYPSGVVARAGAPDDARHEQSRAPIEVAVHRAHSVFRWRSPRTALGAFADDPAAPWLLLPPEARAAFERLRDRGVPLAESAFGPPLLGVKTGCNDAFIVHAVLRGEELTEVVAGDRRGSIESALLRPLLRGETLGAPDECAMLLWTHDASGAPLRRLPRHAARWLAPHEAGLRRRADLRSGTPWWSLFRTPSARCDRARLVWADMAREPRVQVLSAGDPTVVLNSCYLLPCARHNDAVALAALLRSPLCSAWLRSLGEPARGGYLRYLAWTVALLPIPRDWRTARRALSRLSPSATVREQTATAAAGYGLELDAVMPLVEWNTR